MISGEFIVKKNKYLLPLASILALGAYLRLFKINQAFPFDHDQEFVANSAYNFYVSDKLTLIGQELSFPGFFLGPLHNWILFVPYKICNLSPACVPYFFITVGLITAALLYLVVKKVTDKKTAVAAAAIYALSFAAITFERGASSNFFLFLSNSRGSCVAGFYDTTPFCCQSKMGCSRSAKTKPSRLTISPNCTGTGCLNIGPS